MRRWLLGSLLFLMGASTAWAEVTAGITRGSRQQTGVRAEATVSYSSSVADAHRASSTEVAGVRMERGPVLVPLASQVSCGHDPRIPGGLTCFVPPPPRPELSNARPPRRRPTPDEVARRLTDRAIRLAPRPQLRFAPGRRGLTGLPSYFWLGEPPEPIVARAGVGGLTVTAQARPVQYIWNYGDGQDKATRRPGRRWTKKRPGSIHHTYEAKARYAVTVEVIWQARWRIGTGAWQSLGYFTNSSTRTYRVRSIAPVLVRAR